LTTQIHEEQISGVVERITFHSIETGWSVLKVAPFNSPSTIIPIIIHQAQVFAGASMKFFGNWINHPKYGEHEWPRLEFALLSFFLLSTQ